MKPKNLKQLRSRGRGLRAQVLNKNLVVVSSRTNPQANHVVTVEYDSDGRIYARCTCPWAINGGIACSHVLAALDALAARRGRKLSFWNSLQDARRQKHRLFLLTDGMIEDGVWITSRKDAA